MTTPTIRDTTSVAVPSVSADVDSQKESCITLEKVLAVAATVSFVVSVYFGSVACGGVSLAILIYLALQYCCCSEDLPQRNIVPGMPGHTPQVGMPSSLAVNAGNVSPLQAGRVSSPLVVSPSFPLINGVFSQNAQSQGTVPPFANPVPASNSSTASTDLSLISGNTSPRGTQGQGTFNQPPLPTDPILPSPTPDLDTSDMADVTEDPALPDNVPPGRGRTMPERNKRREIAAFTKLLQQREALRRQLPGNPPMAMEQQREQTRLLLEEIDAIRLRGIHEIKDRIRTLRLEIDALRAQAAAAGQSAVPSPSRQVSGNQFLDSTQTPVRFDLTHSRAPSMRTITLPSDHRPPLFTPTLSPIAEAPRQPQQATLIPNPLPSPGPELVAVVVGGSPTAPARSVVVDPVVARHTTISAQMRLQAAALLQQVNGQVGSRANALAQQYAQGRRGSSSQGTVLPRRDLLVAQFERLDQDAAALLAANPGLNLGPDYEFTRERIRQQLHPDRP